MKYAAAPLALLFAAACGDGTSDDRDPLDPAADAAPAPDADPSAPDAGPTARVFAVATDYATAGVAATIDLPSLVVTSPAIAGVASTDPGVKKLDDLFVINRFGSDNLTIVDADGLTLIDQVSTGGGSNPQDVDATADRLYVSVLAGAGVLVFDRADLQAGPIDTIDLSDLDAVDGLPDCGNLAIVGDRLFVACGVVDENFAPRGPGRVAVVDLASDEVETVVELPFGNPFGGFAVTSLGLLVETVPSFGDLTAGCVAAIDPAAATPTATCLIDNADLGGYASAIAAQGDALWLAVSTGFDDGGALGALRRRTADGTLEASITPAEQRPFDVVACPTGHLAVADAAGGVRVYQGEGDAAGDEVTSEPLDLGLPPVGGGMACY